MDYLEKAKSATSAVSNKLDNLPELVDTRERLNSFEVGKIYIDYLRIIKDLASLDQSEIAQIQKANAISAKRGLSTNSASHGGADYFLSIIGPQRQGQLLNTILESADEQSLSFQAALSDLSNRMTKGHELSATGATVADGASADADFAIWGHTKGLQPQAMAHFVICHFLERTLTAQFTNDPDPNVRQLVSKKDTLLAAMGDVIRLRKAQGKADPEIVSMWESTRGQGGLQWNRRERQTVYNEAVTQNVVDTLSKTERLPLSTSEVAAILPILRQQFQEADIRLNLSHEARQSLSKKQFRNLDEGRGPGIVEALGQRRAEDLLDWCQTNGKVKIAKTKDTKGRGLRQLAADTIQLLSNPNPAEDQIREYTNELNQRVMYGLLKKYSSNVSRQAEVMIMFASTPKTEDEKDRLEFATVPQGSILKLVDFLTSKQV